MPGGAQELLKEKGLDATWDWRRVQSLQNMPQAQVLSRVARSLLGRHSS